MMDHRSTFRSRRTDYLAIVTALLVNHLLSWLILRSHPKQGFSALYIDPGSGILIWQLLAAAAIGFVFNIRCRIARLIKRLRLKKN